MRPFHLIVSCSENRVIGRDGRLPWHLPEDFAFFERQTAGQIVILGRICFETWPGAVRAGRRAVVVTSRPAGALPRFPAATAADLPAALAAAAALPGEIYICGGEAIYREAIAHPAADLLFLTLVHADVAGDRSFPEWRTEFPVEVGRREAADARWRYTFFTFGRGGRAPGPPPRTFPPTA